MCVPPGSLLPGGIFLATHVDDKRERPEDDIEAKDVEELRPRHTPYQPQGDPCILPDMTSPRPTTTHDVRRRPSKLSQWLSNEKIEQARSMTPEKRVMVALHLSDFCLDLSHVCSRKP